MKKVDGLTKDSTAISLCSASGAAVAAKSVGHADSLRIALLTPYSGGNLGDGAIQGAVMDNLRARCPRVELVLLTAQPRRTSGLHAVRSLPITGIRIPGYSNTIGSTAQGDVASRPNGRPKLSRLKSRLKQLGPVGRAVRLFYAVLRSALRAPRTVAGELGHLAMARRVVRTVDCVLVSGGGQIDDYWGGPFGHPYTLAKWSLLAQQARTPFIVAGVGVCELNSHLSRFFVRHALRRAAARSYRDHKSKALLSYLPFVSADPVVPDLAFSHRAIVAQGQRPASSGRAEVVGVSPIAYLSHFGWPDRDPDIFERYIGCLTSFVLDLLREDRKVVLFATDDPDRRAVEELVDRASRSDVDMAGLRVSDAHSAQGLVSELSSMDLVVASRLHALILANLVSVPTLAISYDRKVDTYMNDMEQTEFCVDIHETTCEQLSGQFEALEVRRQETAAKIRKKVLDSTATLDRLYDGIVEMASSCADSRLADAGDIVVQSEVDRSRA